MRTETVTRTLYTAAELKELHPRGFDRAMDWHARCVCDDPAWASEHRASLKAALEAIGDAAPTIEGPRVHRVRRCMAWLENHVLGPLRAPWAPIAGTSSASKRRREVARYGAWYRPGNVRPCLWTGYCVDEDLIDAMREAAREGLSPDEWPRRLRDVAERLWEEEVAGQCSEEAFLETAEANGWEFTEHGAIA